METNQKPSELDEADQMGDIGGWFQDDDGKCYVKPNLMTPTSILVHE
jgi:hypothetical protein